MTGHWRLGVETGGTKVIARLTEDNVVRADARWPTTTPDAAVDAIVAFVRGALSPGALIEAAGIAAFGPLLVDLATGDAGRMLQTPKPFWSGSNLRAALAERLGTRVEVDTDVNAAALAELRIGAGRGLPSLAYLTVGTGIGGGRATAAGTLTGALHPEIGHLRLIRQAGDSVGSTCPFHDDCAEGLAAGPAVARRLGGDSLAGREDVRLVVAEYLAQLCVAIVLFWSPHRIVVGGGIATAPGMLDALRVAYARSLGSYGVGAGPRANDFILAAELADAGLEGALFLAGGGQVQ